MRFELLIGNDSARTRCLLDGTREYTLGSGADCEPCIALATVSRRHATLRLEPAPAIRDLGARNGVEIDGVRIAPGDWVRLPEGCELRLGHVPLRLRALAEGDAEVALALPQADAPATSPLPAVTLAAGASDRFTRKSLAPLLRLAAAGAARVELARALGEAWMRLLPLRALAIADSADACLFLARTDAGTPIELEHEDLRVQAELAPGQDPAGFSHLAELAHALLALARPARRAPPAEAEIEWPTPQPLDPRVRKLHRQAARVARSGIHVLVRGESGTGKELLARFLHAHSGQPETPFVAVNCAAFPEDLLEAELFGVEKGVATGVDARAGLFERADGGTLFLDEIGDMAPATQARILRVLQEREVWRLGARSARPARVRVVSATHRDLAAMRASGAFRDDLWHRIADWEVELPPLRERVADIGNLALHFLARAAAARGLRVRGISRRALDALLAWRWPGNIRELEREMQRAVAFLDHDAALTAEELRPEIRGAATAGEDLASQLAREERRLIEAAMARSGDDVDAAAARLGISRATLYRRLATWGAEGGERQQG